jgi:predicted component of type VI protein secretion system
MRESTPAELSVFVDLQRRPF